MTPKLVDRAHFVSGCISWKKISPPFPSNLGHETMPIRRVTRTKTPSINGVSDRFSGVVGAPMLVPNRCRRCFFFQGVDSLTFAQASQSGPRTVGGRVFLAIETRSRFVKSVTMVRRVRRIPSRSFQRVLLSEQNLGTDRRNEIQISPISGLPADPRLDHRVCWSDCPPCAPNFRKGPVFEGLSFFCPEGFPSGTPKPRPSLSDQWNLPIPTPGGGGCL